MKNLSLVARVLVLFAVGIASLGLDCHNPAGPWIDSTDPTFLTITPGNIMGITLHGQNLALPTTNGTNFETDIQVYFHWVYPDATDWTQIPVPNFASWNDLSIGVQFPPTRDYPRPQLALDHEGQIELKVVVRTLGESNHMPVEVHGVAGSPHIDSTSPASLPFTPEAGQQIQLHGSNFQCPDTTGATAEQDTQIYWRYVTPNVTSWVQFDNRYFYAGSNTEADLSMTSYYFGGPYALTSRGQIQYKVHSRCHGDSNVFQVNVQ
jgi:hypothetical protein